MLEQNPFVMANHPKGTTSAGLMLLRIRPWMIVTCLQIILLLTVIPQGIYPLIALISLWHATKSIVIFSKLSIIV